MANRNMFPCRSNMGDLALVHCRLDFATDIGAAVGAGDAYDCVDGIYNDNGFVSAVERTAEGTFKVYFADKWYAFGGLAYARVKDADVHVVVLAEDVDNATAGSGYVQIAFQTAGTDADPDAELVELNFWLHNSLSGVDSA
jgi:hypothetical protein